MSTSAVGEWPIRQVCAGGVTSLSGLIKGETMGEGTSGDERVVVWSTGGIGSLSIVAVNERPDLELVGVWVHSEDKVGKDAGELANGVPIGSSPPTTWMRLFALNPDCVIYAASGPERDAGAVPDYERLLAAGINVVTTTSTTLINPLAYVPAHRERLEAAASRRWSLDLRVAASSPDSCATSCRSCSRPPSRSVSKVHCYEIALYDDYGVEEIMIDALGFGRPLDFEPWIMLPGAIASEFEGQVRYIADGLGVDDRRDSRDLRPASDRAADRDRLRDGRTRHLRRDPLPGDRHR